jgi:hypothetical protein
VSDSSGELIAELGSSDLSDTAGQDVPTAESSTAEDNEASATAEVSDTPGQDVPTAESSTAEDNEASATAEVSDTPGQDLWTAETSTVASEGEQSAATERPPDASDIALLYAQYLLTSEGERADGEVLYGGQQIPMQFFVSVLKLQDTDLGTATVDNLRTIAQLYVMYH